MKKKMLSLLLSAVMVAGVLAGCGSKEEATTTETTEEATEEVAEEVTETEETTFTVGFDAEFPPYGYMDESGEYVGFDLSLAQEVCDRLGWTLVKQPIAWDSKDMELETGNIDCIWNGFTMNGREEQYAFTAPYVDNSQVFVVTKDSGITSWADLAGKEVLVQADSSAEKALKDEENAEAAALLASFGALTAIPDYNSAFNSLEMGAGDAVAMDVGVAQYQIESRETEFVILEDVIAAEQYAVGFALDNTELRDTVEATLAEMAEDGTFAAIAEEWGLTDSVCLGK